MKKGLLSLSFLTVMTTAAFLSFNLIGAPPEHKERMVTVTSIYCSVAIVTSEDGTTRSVMVDEVKREEVPWLQEGDRIVLEIDERNEIIAIHLPHRHSMIAGALRGFLRQINSVNLWNKTI